MKHHLARPGVLVVGVILALLFGLVGSTPALADDGKGKGDQDGASVGLRPANSEGGDTTRSSFEYEIVPRGVQQDYVAVSNLRKEPITVRLFGKDATTTTDTPYAVQTSDSAPKDVGAWIAFRRTTLTIPARTEMIVPFQVGVPYNAEPGEHTGAIVVSLLAKEPKPDGGEIVVDHRVSLRLLLRVPGDYNAQLTVSDFEASWASPGSPLGKGDTVVTYTVKNTGNLRVSATGQLELSRVLGLPSVEARTAPITEIQPGGVITVRQVVPGVFGTGPMKAHLTLHPTPIDPELKDVSVKTVSATASFPAWPWLLIAIVVGLLVLSWLTARYERRRRRARRAAMAPTGGKYRAAVDPDARRDGDVMVRLGLATVAAALVGLGLAAPASAADKVDEWQARGSVAKGTDQTPLDIITTGGCPLPGNNVDGFMFGKGFPKEGGVAVGIGDAGVESRGAFRMPMAKTFQQLMAEQPNPAPFSGVYKIVLNCVTEDLQTTTGRYIFAIRFTDPTHWKAEPPLTTTKGPVTTGDATPNESTDPTDGSNPATPGDGASLSPEEQQEAADRAAELAGVQDQEASTKSDPNWWLIGGGIAVLGATGLVLLRRNKA